MYFYPDAKNLWTGPPPLARHNPQICVMTIDHSGVVFRWPFGSPYLEVMCCNLPCFSLDSPVSHR